ncbi:TonB-dependent receptor domain-containing protein [Sphingomonas sp. DT-51]|uniref:TonB-dependent receptor domain-containing protein n=1 Tax=Sphingomonas sp. DT-51 TaxID=3396165 RepID=UPI003F1DE120
MVAKEAAMERGTLLNADRKILRAALLATTGLFAFAPSAWAQDSTSTQTGSLSAPSTPADQDIRQQTTDPSTPSAAATTQEAGGDVVVTGTLFRTSTETPSPVTTLTAETLARGGVTSINEAIRSVSADSAGSIPTGFQGGFSAGGSAVSLRGLGVSSTLVLIDGLRSTNFPLNDDGHNSYVDLNSIPFSVVERVDVLKDGASSTYGADAIGGVVNIILRKQFQGVDGTVEGGIGEKGYASRYRANLTVGYGDYEEKGWNVYVNGEYQRDGAVSVRDVGFPFNTTDLSSIGLLDNNTADSSLVTATTNAVVVRANANDPNNPFAGGTLVRSGSQADGSAFYNYQLLNANCPGATYTVSTGTNRGIGCARDLTTDYAQVQPEQERYSFTSRLSVRLNDAIEAYALGSYSHSQVNILGTPAAIRLQQPYGASPTTSSLNPGIVLPVYVCSAGVNCSTATDGRLNPNNPFAAEGNAARIYYRFGDIPVGSRRGNELIRGAIGLNGRIGDDTNWRVEAVGARDNINFESYGVLNIAGLRQAVATGAYNFVNPEQNSQAVRAAVSPDLVARGYTSLASLDGSVSTKLFDLPGGPLQAAVGGQVRRETLNYPGLNPDLVNYANTAAAFGRHTVSAAYFELDAPVVDKLRINAAGRYDHYSEGFSHFSPKIGATFTPVRQLLIRGTYSEGFRAPTFAESNPRSSYPGFVTYTPPASFQQAHGGLITAGNTNPYAQAYSVGGGFSGNPDLKPETSRSFTAGIVVEPVRWFSFTVDFYNVKKKDVIVAGPNAGAARAAYFAGQPLPEGYTAAIVDAPDPLFPNALPRVLVINGPYVNSGYFKTQGLDFSATIRAPITDDIRFISRLDANYVDKFDVDFGDGAIRRYVGTLGPYELSSGAGTPRWRGNWQNTLEFGAFSVTATAYYVSRIKSVAADEVDPDDAGNIDLSCGQNLYGTGDDACYIKRFIYADLNASVKINDSYTFFVNVNNVTNERAPIAPASYSGTNYLPTWHYAGVIGRVFRAGASFKF